MRLFLPDSSGTIKAIQVEHDFSVPCDFGCSAGGKRAKVTPQADVTTFNITIIIRPNYVADFNIQHPPLPLTASPRSGQTSMV